MILPVQAEDSRRPGAALVPPLRAAPGRATAPVGAFCNASPPVPPQPAETRLRRARASVVRININRILEERLLQPRDLVCWCAMDELKAELKLFAWLLWVDTALLLACLAIVVLREFG
jgi:hypothetical protein